jgi:hypothetical protein
MLGRLEQDVQRLLGFDGTADTVTVHYAYDWADGANTVNSGTAFFGLDRTAGRQLAQRLDSARTRTRHPPRLHPRPACRRARRPHRALVPQRVRQPPRVPDGGRMGVRHPLRRRPLRQRGRLRLRPPVRTPTSGSRQGAWRAPWPRPGRPTPSRARRPRPPTATSTTTGRRRQRRRWSAPTRSRSGSRSTRLAACRRWTPTRRAAWAGRCAPARARSPPPPPRCRGRTGCC